MVQPLPSHSQIQTLCKSVLYSLIPQLDSVDLHHLNNPSKTVNLTPYQGVEQFHISSYHPALLQLKRFCKAHPIYFPKILCEISWKIILEAKNKSPAQLKGGSPLHIYMAALGFFDVFYRRSASFRRNFTPHIGKFIEIFYSLVSVRDPTSGFQNSRVDRQARSRSYQYHVKNRISSVLLDVLTDWSNLKSIRDVNRTIVHNCITLLKAQFLKQFPLVGKQNDVVNTEQQAKELEFVLKSYSLYFTVVSNTFETINVGLNMIDPLVAPVTENSSAPPPHNLNLEGMAKLCHSAENHEIYFQIAQTLSYCKSTYCPKLRYWARILHEATKDKKINTLNRDLVSIIQNINGLFNYSTFVLDRCSRFGIHPLDDNSKLFIQNKDVTLNGDTILEPFTGSQTGSENQKNTCVMNSKWDDNIFSDLEDVEDVDISSIIPQLNESQDILQALGLYGNEDLSILSDDEDETKENENVEEKEQTLPQTKHVDPSNSDSLDDEISSSSSSSQPLSVVQGSQFQGPVLPMPPESHSTLKLNLKSKVDSDPVHDDTTDNQDSIPSLKTQSHIFQDLLKRAPIVPGGAWTELWDQESIPANNSGIERIHRVYGSENPDSAVSAERIPLSFRNPTIVLTTPRSFVEKSCRFPLYNGSLCQRKDKTTCPFHGLIVPRDQFGRPASDKDPFFMINTKNRKVPDSALEIIPKKKRTKKGNFRYNSKLATTISREKNQLSRDHKTYLKSQVEKWF